MYNIMRDEFEAQWQVILLKNEIMVKHKQCLMKRMRFISETLYCIVRFTEAILIKSSYKGRFL